MFPVLCNGNITGSCNRGFLGTLLAIAAILGGFGTANIWTAKKMFLSKCGGEERASKNHDIFTIILGFGAILAAIFGLALLANAKVQKGLYVILLIMAINAVIIQISNYLTTHSYA